MEDEDRIEELSGGTEIHVGQGVDDEFDELVDLPE